MKHNVKIVVVEADARIRELIVDILEFCVNRAVVSFEDGEAAWRHLKRPGRSHIVIAEIDIPGIKGDELLRRVKKSDPHKVCILMSSRAADEKTAQSLETDAFLAKPFVVDDLFEIVRRFVVEE